MVCPMQAHKRPPPTPASVTIVVWVSVIVPHSVASSHLPCQSIAHCLTRDAVKLNFSYQLAAAGRDNKLEHEAPR